MLQILVDALVRAAELGLVAVGLTMTWGIARFANVAHVQYTPVAAFVTLTATQVLAVGLLPGAVLAIVLTGLLGAVLHRAVFRRLAAASAATALIGSLAMSIVINATIQTIAGPRPRSLPVPIQPGFAFGGAVVTRTQLWIIVVAAVVLTATFVALATTRTGRAVRCVAANAELAEASGINSARITVLVVMVSAALAGLGGVLLAMDTTVNLNMGAVLLLPVFAAVVMGGIGSPAGAVAAAAVLALVENALLRIDFGAVFGGQAYLPVNYRPAIGFVALILIMLLRPQGIFSLGGRRA